VLYETDTKEELSLAYVHAVATKAGFTIDTVRKDRDSVDVIVRARGQLSPTASVTSPAVDIQLKAHVKDPLPDGEFPFDVPVKNYNDLVRRCLIPRILVVFTMPADEASWVSCSEDELILRRSAYWISLLGRKPTKNSQTERVQLARAQTFDPAGLAEILRRIGEEEDLP
jgi:hypothetical protein